MEVGQQRGGLVLADSATLSGRPAADLGLDGVEGGDALDRLRRQRRRAVVLQELEKLSATVGPAVGELQIGALLGEGLVDAIAIALGHASEAVQHAFAMGGAAARRIGEDHDRRILPRIRSAVAGYGPEVARLCAASSWIEDAHIGLVDEEM